MGAPPRSGRARDHSEPVPFAGSTTIRESIDVTLQQLLDRTEITDLVSRLGASLDEGRFDDMHALMVEEVGARTPGGEREGRDAVVGVARKNHRPEWGHEHVITNVLVDLDGDRARVRANLVVHSAPDGPAAPGATPAPEGPLPPLLAPKVTFMLGEVYGVRRRPNPRGVALHTGRGHARVALGHAALSN